MSETVQDKDIVTTNQ